jgi:hypothetical protein
MSTNKSEHFSLNTPVKYMNKVNLDAKSSKHLLNNLEKVKHYLHKPNVERDEDGNIRPIKLTCTQRICKIASTIFLYIRRIWNVLFGDHVYYNELKARDIVVFYLSKQIHRKERNPERARKILEIYENLTSISDGKGTSADKINPALLQRLRTSLGKYDKKKADENRINPDKYMLSNQPEETLPAVPNEAAMAHHFEQIAGFYAPGERTLLHIEGNRFGKNSRLEPFDLNKNIDYLHSYLKARLKQSPNTAIEQFVEKLSHAKELADTFKIPLTRANERLEKAGPAHSNRYKTSAEEKKEKDEDRLEAMNAFIHLAQSKLRNADQNTSVLIPGGWVGKSTNGSKTGSALFFEVMPSKGKLRIYNTSSGADNHNSAIVGNKTKYQAYTEWSGIDTDKLQSQSFLRSIAEMQIYEDIPSDGHAYSVENTKYNERDIYIGLKKILSPSCTDEDQEPTHLISKESAQLCATRGMFAVLRTHLEESGPEGKGHYKRFKCDLKIQALVDQILHPVGITEISEAAYARLIEKSLQKTCKSIHRLYSKKLAADHYIEEAHKALTPVKQWLEEKKKNLCVEKVIVGSRFGAIFRTISFDRFDTALEESKIKGLELSNSQTGEFLTEQFKALSVANSQTLSHNLEQIASIGKNAWANGNDQSLYTGLLHVINSLSTDEKFWKTAFESKTKEAKEVFAKELISPLGEISHLFFKTCFTIFQPEIILPERVQAFIKVQVVLKRILSQIGVKAEFHIPRSVESHISSYIHLNEAADKENSELAANYYSDGSTRFGSLISWTYSNSISASFNHHPEGIVKLAKEFEPSITRFANGPSYEQNSQIYVLESLPKWLQALRNIPIFLEYMSSCAVGKPPAVNREKDFELSFTATTDHEYSSASVKIVISNLNKDVLAEQDPIVREIAYVPNARFEYIHGITETVIENSGKNFYEIQKSLLGTLLRSLYHSEKALVSDKTSHKDKKIDAEEFQALHHIFSNKETMITEALEYFTKHSEKIKNKEYQNLFRVALFQPLVLKEALKHEGLAESIELFIERNIKDFRNLKAIQSCVFLLQCRRFLGSFDPKRFAASDNLRDLRSMLNQQELEPENKSVIYAELIATLAGKPSNLLDNQDKIDLIIGKAFLRDNPVPKKWQEPLTENEVGKAGYHHANAIKDFLCPGNTPNADNLNEILLALQPQASKIDHWTLAAKNDDQLVLKSACNRYTLRPLEGILIDAKETHVFLPLEIRHHAQFKALFPGFEKANRISDNMYTFTDQNGRKTNVSMNYKEKTVRIEQYDEEKKCWLRFVQPDVFLEKTLHGGMKRVTSCHLKSRHLVQEFSHWQVIKNPTNLFLRNNQTDRFEYKVNLVFVPFYESDSKSKQSLESIIRCKDNLELSDSSETFTGFEDPTYIQEWYTKEEFEVPGSWLKEKQLRQVELPRFGLTFDYVTDKETSEKRYECREFKGFFLSKDQAIAQLGSFKHHLVIENAQGQKKVLIPQQDFVSKGINSEVLDAEFGINRELESSNRNPQRYIAYDLSDKGTLASRSLEANLYLVQVFTAIQEYATAAQYLKQYGLKLSAYSPREAHILSEICGQRNATHDYDGNAHALRAYAGYLLLKNGFSHRQVHKESLGHTYENYSDYLDAYRHATVLRFEPREEISLLTMLCRYGFDPQLFLRLRELDPDAARAVRIPEDNTFKKQKDQREIPISEALPHPNFFSAFDFSKPDTSKVLLTRVKAELKTHFVKYFTLAVEGTPQEKQWFFDALCFLSSSERAEDVALANIFVCILENSSKFSMPKTRSASGNISSEIYRELSDWREQVLKTAKEILTPKLSAEQLEKQEKLEKENKKSNVPLNMTPANFQVEEEERDENIAVKIDVAPTLSPKKDSWSLMSRSWFIENPYSEQEFAPTFSAWLEERLKSDNDLLQTKAYEELRQDFAALQKQQSIKYSLKDEGALDALKANLETGKESSAKVLRDMELNILERANKLPDNKKELPLHFMKEWSGRIQPVTIDEVIVSFARCKINPEALKRLNPRLNDDDLKAIYASVGEYLLLKTHEQQRARALDTYQKYIQLKAKNAKALNDKDKKLAEDAENDMLQQLANDLSAQHYHDPKNKIATVEPHFLAFEYFAGMMLRHEQVQRINEFLESGDVNIVMEMIMGFGKSKVLLPLLALLLKKPLLIVPQSLFENVSADTKRILQDAFGRSLHSLTFDRSTMFSKHSLGNLLREITNAQDSGECLIMTSKSFQCLLLKFIEMVGKHFEENEELLMADGSIPLDWSEELTLMQQILGRFDDARAIIDEADTVLNVLRKVCFSIGQKRPPEAHEARCISEILTLVYENPELKALGRPESDPDALNDAPALTEDVYHSNIKKPLAEAFIERLEGMDLKSHEYTKAIEELVPALKNKSNRQALLDYLCRDQDADKRTAAQKFYNAQSAEAKEILALAGQMISQFLPHTLTRVNNEKYGIDLDSDSSIAVPFLAANTPSRGSQFANRHITMMYTFQSINKNGITQKMLESEIERIRTQAMREVREEGSKISLEDTKAWKRFELLKGDVNIPLFNSKPDQIKTLLNKLNATVDSKRNFVENIIIPQLELYDQQISCNPLNFASFLPFVSGFTGTLWNQMSMHRKIKHKPAEGIGAKTLELLFRKSRHKDAVVAVNEGKISEMLKQLGDGAYDVIIDAGGYFKQGTNQEIARQFANHYKKSVVFYNSQGEQTITNGHDEMALSQSSLKETDYITFLDQDHTTGADVKYKRDAVGLVTIGRNMLKRDLAQAPWRLRGLDKLQKPVFAVSDDVATIVRQATGLGKREKILIDHIAKFTIANQAEQQSRDNFQSFTQQLWDIPQQLLLRVLKMGKLTPDQYYEVYQELHGLWIKPGTNSCSDLYGNIAFERPATEIVDEEKKSCEKFLKELHEKLPWLEEQGVTLQESLDCIEELNSHFENALPKTVVHPQQDSEATTELEQELQVESEREVQLEKLTEANEEGRTLGDLSNGSFVDFDQLTNDLFTQKGSGGFFTATKPAPTPRFSLKLFMDQDPVLVRYANAFRELDVSLNVFAWTATSHPNVSGLELLGRYRTPLHHVEVDGDRVTLMSQGDAAYRANEKSLYNLTTGFINKKKTEKLSLAARKKIVIAKFLNGESHFSATDSKLLTDWLRTYGSESLRTLYVDHILPGYPQKEAAYRSGSQLLQIFNSLNKAT